MLFLKKYLSRKNFFYISLGSLGSLLFYYFKFNENLNSYNSFYFSDYLIFELFGLIIFIFFKLLDPLYNYFLLMKQGMEIGSNPIIFDSKENIKNQSYIKEILNNIKLHIRKYLIYLLLGLLIPISYFIYNFKVFSVDWNIQNLFYISIVGFNIFFNIALYDPLRTYFENVKIDSKSKINISNFNKNKIITILFGMIIIILLVKIHKINTELEEIQMQMGDLEYNIDKLNDDLDNLKN